MRLDASSNISILVILIGMFVLVGWLSEEYPALGRLLAM